MLDKKDDILVFHQFTVINFLYLPAQFLNFLFRMFFIFPGLPKEWTSEEWTTHGNYGKKHMHLNISAQNTI